MEKLKVMKHPANQMSYLENKKVKNTILSVGFFWEAYQPTFVSLFLCQSNISNQPSLLLVLLFYHHHRKKYYFYIHSSLEK